uniref:Uncharacterized protein n=1 Tax=Leptocylindrus danicus TaxID=163516 RepID=A0A7S2P2C9_9STRA
MHNPNQYHYKDEILSVSAARLGEETFQVRGFACRSNTHTPAPSSSNGISTSTNNDLLTVQQVMNFASNPALLSRWCAPIRNLTITKDSSSSSSSGTHTPSTSRFQNQQFMNQQQAHQQSPIPPPLHYNNNNNKNQYEYDGEWVEGDAALVNPGSKCGLYNVSSMVLQQLSDGFQKASRLLLPESTSSSTPLTATTRGSGDNAYMYSNPMQNSNLSQQQQQQQGNVTLFIERKRGQLAITMSPVGGCEVTYTLTFQQSSSSANTSTNNTSTTTATRIGVQIINTVRVDRSSVNCCYGAVVPRSVKEWVLPSMASHIQQGIDAMELLIQLVQQNANAGDVVNSSSGSFDNSPTLSGGGMYAGVLGTLSNAIGGRFGVDNSNETKVPLLDATL